LPVLPYQLFDFKIVNTLFSQKVLTIVKPVILLQLRRLIGLTARMLPEIKTNCLLTAFLIGT